MIRRLTLAALALLLLAISLPGEAATLGPLPAVSGDPRTPWPTWSHDNANVYSNGGLAIYDLWVLLDAVGWETECSGGGTGSGCNESDATCVTAANLDNGALENFILQPPGGGAQWIFWHNLEDGTSWWSIGRDTGATSTCSEASRNRGADYENVIGTGGVAAAVLWTSGDLSANITCNIGADSAAPYSWFLACRVGTGDSSGSLWYDGLRGYDSSDTDPFVTFGDADLENVDQVASGNIYRAGGDMGGTWRALSVVFGYTHFTNLSPNGLPVNPGSGDDVLTLAKYADPGVGHKGVSRWLLAITETDGRAHGATYDIDTDGDGTHDYQCTRFGDLCFPSASGTGGTYDAFVPEWAE